MEFRAKANFTRVSPQKARLVLDLIKGKRVEDAVSVILGDELIYNHLVVRLAVMNPRRTT